MPPPAPPLSGSRSARPTENGSMDGNCLQTYLEFENLQMTWTTFVVCRCTDGYFGNPREYGSSCEAIDCSGNVNVSDPTNYDRLTGECLKCSHPYTGRYCEECMQGFYGDAPRQRCKSKLIKQCKILKHFGSMYKERKIYLAFTG